MKIHDLEVTGSLIYNGVNLLSLTSSVTDSGSFSAQIVNLNQVSSSLNSFTSSINTTIKNKLDSESVISGSAQVLITGTTGYSTFSSSISNSIGDLSSSVATTTSGLSSSIGSLSGSVATTTSGLASRIGSVETKTGSYATTGSNVFVGSQVITGSICSTGDIVTTGQIVAQTINVQQVTSSIVYSCGSNIFGNGVSNTQQFTGSILATGSLTLTGPMIGSSTVCGVMANFSCVGIGTQSPSVNLEVIGTIASGNGDLGMGRFYYDTDTVKLQASKNGTDVINMSFWTQASGGGFAERMRITGGGLVGVNITTPSAELQVNKNCDVTIALSNCIGVTSGNRGALAFYNCATSTVAMIRAAAVTDNVGTELQFHTRPAAGSLTQIMTLGSTGVATFACQVCSPNHIASSTCSTAGLRVYGASGTHQWDMYLNGANLRFSDNTSGGCFVVDTSSTFGGDLYIKKSDGFQNIIIQPTTTTAAAGTRFLNTGNDMYMFIDNSGGDYGPVGANGASYAYNANIRVVGNRALQIATNDTVRMSISNTGNVGIGVTPCGWAAPTAGKVIQLGNRVSLFSYNNNTLDLATNFYFDGGDYRYIQSAYATLLRSDSSDGTFVFYNAGSGTAGCVVSLNERMRITNAGNTEIRGGNILNIYRTDNTRALQLYTTSNETVIDSWEATSEPLHIRSNGTGGRIQFFTCSTERMRITSGGLVSINTTSTAATLNLKAQSNCRAILFKNANDGDGSLWLYGTSTTMDYSFSTYSVGNAFYLYNNGNYSFAGSNVSDRRLKENIEVINYNATEKLMQLIPKSYNMIKHSDIKRSGFIAQEVKEILPDLITGTETNEEYLGLDYNGLLSIAIKSIQEQQSTICSQSQKIAILESCLGIM